MPDPAIYATASDVLRKFDAEHVASLADPSAARLVSGELLAATVADEDRSEWEEPEVAAADEAAAIIQDALGAASREMDTYIRQRHALPLVLAEGGDAATLKTHCLYIARWHLADSDDRLSDDIRDRYRDSVAWLKSLAAGKASLSVVQSDTGRNSTAHRSVVRQGVSNVNWGSYP